MASLFTYLFVMTEEHDDRIRPIEVFLRQLDKKVCSPVHIQNISSHGVIENLLFGL
jgi:hypothetical protein